MDSFYNYRDLLKVVMKEKKAETEEEKEIEPEEKKKPKLRENQIFYVVK